jgi:hypothetical protein
MPLIFIKPLLICYLIFGFSSKDTIKSSNKHPFHLSSTELDYNSKENTWELSCRIFTDDLEAALSKNHKEMDVLVKKYALANLGLRANGKVLSLNYLGFEKDNEAVVVYLESETVKGVKKLETTNSILYDQYDDQSNIIHVTYSGNRKSSKLDYPSKKLVNDF